MRLISLYSAFYAGNCKRDTTRPCFCSAFAAGRWPYSNLPISLLPIGPTWTNPLHATAVVNSMGQTDGQTDRHSNVTYTLPHTMWVLSIRKQFCADYCMLLLLRCLELAGSLHSSDWPHENLSSNVSRLAQGRPACSRVERFQKSKFSRERLPCFRGCENAFGNSDC